MQTEQEPVEEHRKADGRLQRLHFEHNRVPELLPRQKLNIYNLLSFNET